MLICQLMKKEFRLPLPVLFSMLTKVMCTPLAPIGGCLIRMQADACRSSIYSDDGNALAGPAGMLRAQVRCRTVGHWMEAGSRNTAGAAAAGLCHC